MYALTRWWTSKNRRMGDPRFPCLCLVVLMPSLTVVQQQMCHRCKEEQGKQRPRAIHLMEQWRMLQPHHKPKHHSFTETTRIGLFVKSLYGVMFDRQDNHNRKSNCEHGACCYGAVPFVPFIFLEAQNSSPGHKTAILLRAIQEFRRSRLWKVLGCAVSHALALFWSHGIAKLQNLFLFWVSTGMGPNHCEQSIFSQQTRRWGVEFL